MEVKITKEYLSIKPCEFDLPDFTVITGKNGSGKTHLLQALVGIKVGTGVESLAQVSKEGNPIKNIKYIPFNKLTPEIKTSYDPFETQRIAKETWQHLESLRNMMVKSNNRTVLNTNGLILLERMSAKDHHNCKIINLVINHTEKSFYEIDQNDIINYVDNNSLVQHDYFIPELANIFKTYHRLYLNNKWNEFSKQEGLVCSEKILSENEFLEKYGTPPWDIANNVLKRLSIPYHFNTPEKEHKDSKFELILTDDNGLEVQLQNLSTGEQVLLSLTLIAYNAHDSLSDFTKPDLILLDEPDAPLHPSMSKIMVEIIREIIVEQHKIPVIMTTHQPATVFSANGLSLYLMERGISVPQKISSQKAVELLTEDMPFLRITMESRRAVFVESFYDVDFYTELTNILRKNEKLQSEPVFVTAKISGKSNCDEVEGVHAALANVGDELTYGIVDWDSHRKSKPRLIVIGENHRYAIENFVLDPLLLGIYLIHQGQKKGTDFPGVVSLSYKDIDKMTQDEAQSIIDTILNELSLNSSESVEYQLENGWMMKCNRDFNLMQGHALENDVIKKIYPSARAHGGNDGAFKLYMINTVINDFPQFCPKELFDIIRSIK